jgi:choline dehydrogenase
MLSQCAHYHDESKLYSPKLAKVGKKGPLDIAINDMVPELETFRTSLTEAWVSKGEQLTDNVYEGQQNGLVKCMSTIYDGKRSTSVCFLDDKPNITIISETEATKLLLKDKTVYGVDCVDSKGKTFQVTAKNEVILSAGVFHSPKLLMLSGIGPKKHLDSFGIECVVDSAHVGQNLLDHPILPHVFKLKDGCGLDAHLLHEGPMKEAAVRAYNRDRSGPLHSGLLELVGFPRIDKRLEKIPAYVKAKEANGGLDPFGPDGQPHFEVDFVPVFANAFQW